MKGKISFSATEVKQLIISAVALAFAFSLILYRDEIFGAGWFATYSPLFFVNALVAVGLAFILHEIGHKIVAQTKGLWAEFRAWPLGLILAVVLAVFSRGGFVFAAPGAVMISPRRRVDHRTVRVRLKKSDMGKISIAGPTVNIILAAIFGLIALLTGARIASITAQVNSWLAIFNVIPIGVLDGYKIWHWDPKIWFGFMILCVAIFIMVIFV